jgi:hypothetical protein
MDQIRGPAADVWIVAADARGLARFRIAPNIAVGRRILADAGGNVLAGPHPAAVDVDSACAVL